MHKIWTYLFWFFITITATSAITSDDDEGSNQWVAQDDQQPMLDQGAITMTRHITTTRYTFVTQTRSFTRYISDGVTDVPTPVQTWYGAQKERGCDETACASCRVWYKCQAGEHAW